MPTNRIIRLTVTSELQEILSYLKQIYPLLNEAEILKLALGNYYQTLRSPSAIKSQKIDIKKQYEKIYKNIQKRTKGKYLGRVFSQEEIDANSF